jgi:2-dehydro-3-deoxyphosphooctonate aldolase (KDO 8-P synthase)
MSEAPRVVHVGGIDIANDRPFVLIAGPCQIESAGHALEVAAALDEISAATGVRVIYKSSYDKANRTSAGAARGIGMARGLAILADVRERFGMPVLTDVHSPEQCAPAAEVVDVLQIPAFLCRQTDLLLAAGETGRAINVKKGQFLAPWDMTHVAAKIAATGNANILLCERGASFGYNTLVNDFRALPIIRCSSRADWARPPAASGPSPRSWPARRSRSAWRRCSSRPTPTPTTRRATAPP